MRAAFGEEALEGLIGEEGADTGWDDADEIDVESLVEAKKALALPDAHHGGAQAPALWAAEILEARAKNFVGVSGSAGNELGEGRGKDEVCGTKAVLVAALLQGKLELLVDGELDHHVRDAQKRGRQAFVEPFWTFLAQQLADRTKCVKAASLVVMVDVSHHTCPHDPQGIGDTVGCQGASCCCKAVVIEMRPVVVLFEGRVEFFIC